MTEKQPPKPGPGGRTFATEKAVKDFTRVLERKTGKREGTAPVNDNDGKKIDN